MYYVGIDIGSSSAKLTLINSVGDIINEISEEYSISMPRPGWKEIDPEIWMDAIKKSMPQLLKNCNSLEVGAIGVTGQMHTLILLDEKGNVIRPALMWNDIRTKELVSRLKDKIRSMEDISYLSNIISTGSPASNLIWVKENEIENFSKVNKFLIGPDYIVYRLTGNYQTDYCEASTSSMFDLKKKEWSKVFQNEFELDSSIFPEVKGSMEVAGKLKGEWCDLFGFSRNVKVLVGTGDNPAAAISTGCFSKNYPVLSIGTSGVLMYPKKELDFEAKGKNILFAFDQEEPAVLVQGVVQSAGNSMAWWTNQILQTHDFLEETSGIDLESLGQNKLLFYPHLSGDKTIYANPNLKGAFIGLDTSTTRKEMTIAIMEGIAMAVRQLLKVMKMEELECLRITGGGSKNAAWMQIISDVLNKKVIQLESGAGAGYGIALVAASRNENIPLKTIINKSVKEKNIFYPRLKYVELYNQKYSNYLKIYDALKDIYE